MLSKEGATEIARPENAAPNSRGEHRETTRNNAKWRKKL